MIPNPHNPQTVPRVCTVATVNPLDFRYAGSTHLVHKASCEGVTCTSRVRYLQLEHRDETCAQQQQQQQHAGSAAPAAGASWWDGQCHVLLLLLLLLLPATMRPLHPTAGQGGQRVLVATAKRLIAAARQLLATAKLPLGAPECSPFVLLQQ